MDDYSYLTSPCKNHHVPPAPNVGEWTSVKPTAEGLYAYMIDDQGPFYGNLFYRINRGTKWKWICDAVERPPTKPDPGWYIVRMKGSKFATVREVTASEYLSASTGKEQHIWTEYDIGQRVEKPRFE